MKDSIDKVINDSMDDKEIAVVGVLIEGKQIPPFGQQTWKVN